MATATSNGLVSQNHVGAVHPSPANKSDDKKKTEKVSEDDAKINYMERAQWLRPAVLGANDGLVSVASLMMGVGAVKKDPKAMLLAGFAGLVSGACGMAIGEFVAVYTQYDVEIGQMKRDMEMSVGGEKDLEMEMEKRTLPNPLQATLASAVSFSIGALIPLLSAAFVQCYMTRLIVLVATATLALVVFGRVAAQLGKTPKFKSHVRFLLGGWIAMAITFGLTKLLGTSDLM
ncbi:nodulin-21-like [Vigna radiata var. radiata]|uniref:Vacuolar iron transporter n=1 Tax=Vigna radiata var. radiata TaxID=3916 RepID=A0A1S3T8G6_VIGRR|nr:nodulin-21-like [Vigna radiata var. radiata]